MDTLRCQRGGNDRLVRVHVGDGRDADARRLDDVDGVDADARTDVARRRGVVPRHVGRDDVSDDAAILGANAVALPPDRRQDRRDPNSMACSVRTVVPSREVFVARWNFRGSLLRETG